MLTSEQLHNYIAAHLDCEHLQVNGADGQHFDALIVASGFEGKRLVQRHQMVYAALGERMREEIHALSMKTLTPSEYRSEQSGPAATPNQR